MKSVPPRGSGWLVRFASIQEAAARYREVVLTSSCQVVTDFEHFGCGFAAPCLAVPLYRDNLIRQGAENAEVWQRKTC